LGQTTSLSHLAPYVRKSYHKYIEEVKRESELTGIDYTEQQIKDIAWSRTRTEVKDGVQTIQYQIQTLATSNGQSPFVSLFMYLNEDEEYIEEMALIVEEVLKQRIQGVKNEQGVWISPAFPKLLYVLDENNVPKDSKYRYLTDLAIKCVAKRLVPDFISAKKMKEHYDGEVFPCMGCRSFLGLWRNEQGEYQWYGRQNLGVVTVSLPDIGLSAGGDIDKFWDIFEQRLALCKEALLLRVDLLRGASTQISPIHWQHGAISRLSKDETIDSVIDSGACSISLGYIGVYDCVKALIGESHTSERGEKLAIEIMNFMRNHVDQWKKETGLGFGLYGSPSESLTYRVATKLRSKFGLIEGLTDKDYVTNSYHVNVCEEIDAFSKMEFEAQFQKISSGGCISYIEIPHCTHNHKALSAVVDYIYENMQYCEINTKSDYCQVCAFDGELQITDELTWLCPNCGNTDMSKMNVVRRTCGYLGENFWNKGRTQEIKERVLHLE
jgi:ribonucleoside-triphosphate reductase